MERHDQARADLRAYREARPDNAFEADLFLAGILRHHLGVERFDAEAAGLVRFGAEVAGPLDALARETNRDENLPRIRRWDGIGPRRDDVVFHPAYDEIGRSVYRTGVISRYAQPGHEVAQLAYAYMLAQNGEAGHLCPLACTAGLVKILQSAAPAEVRERFLPGLLLEDRLDPRHLHGAQFLTEIQGGSDVGENACVARRDGDVFRIYGEKWFCSVIDADLYLMTARLEGGPPGTRGLGAFVVPRELPDGSGNGIRLRRLKYKLGTRSMASGEADFEGALAHPIALDDGFKAVVDVVLNTSRLYNAVASSGMMRRVEVDASAYAAHRTAFGQRIERFPLVARSLERIRTESRAATAGTFALAALADRIALGGGSDDERAVHRLVVNMNKYWTSVRATAVVHEGIEIFGGNGAIEDFSILPRLYRDAIVCESWEGTHNVLCVQVLKDVMRYRLHEPFFRHLVGVAERSPESDARTTLLARVAEERAALEALLAAPLDVAQLEIRPLVARMSMSWQVASLLDLGTPEALEAAESPVLGRPMGLA
jgi:alkylation response protein AidB-like acyl-CoA dehydrogenase